MNFRRWLPAAIAGVLFYAAWQAYGWAGLAVVTGGGLMWILLHFTRMMSVMKKAADRPKGYVGSAVMLNAKLKPKATLLHVTALTRSLGELLSAQDAEPQVFRWTDGTGSHVTCEFVGGRLMRWTLWRPQAEAAQTPTIASQQG